GYEIAGGLGVKMARPDQEVVVMVGDGSYLMLNSEIATSVMLGLKLTVVLLDNRGYGCINRLQMATGGANFNNLLKDARHVLVIDTDPLISTEAGGHWWDVAVPEVSARREVNAARKKYEEAVGSRQG
ncbi:MAG: 3D-(3,5/4)-trihydroxycyclohexane-1,2-dione acylhydrolase (decyclizing), partial [Mesorhizobium sp.]